jgi:hypothetical protein
MIINYKIMTQINEYMAAMSKALQADAYPVELYRNYRLIYEGINRLSVRLQNYKSNSRDFQRSRELVCSDVAKTSMDLIDE